MASRPPCSHEHVLQKLPLIFAVLFVATVTATTAVSDTLDRRSLSRSLLQVVPLPLVGGSGVAASAPAPAAGRLLTSVAGSWVQAVTLAGLNTTFYQQVTFVPGGGLIQTSQYDAITESAEPGTGHGFWVQNGSRLDYKVLKFVTSTGNLVGAREEFTTGVVDGVGDFFNGTTRMVTYDVNGQRANQQNGTITAQRERLFSFFS